MTESTQPADLSKSAPAVDMSTTFSARVMALPLPEPDVSWEDGRDQWGYVAYSEAHSERQIGDMRRAAAAIAAEADALAEAARGLRVALVGLLDTDAAKTELRYLRKGIGTATKNAVWLHAEAALAAFDKAAGGAAPQPPVAWIGPTGQLMPHEIFVAWREQYPDQGHEHFKPLVYGGAA